MKVKLLKLALATALSLLFFSCKNDNNNIVNEPQNDTSIIEKYSHKITTDEAKEQAIKLYTTAFASSLRSTSIPKIKSIDKIGANGTRSTSNIDDDNEVGIYVINFDDNKGFIILSDDKRTEPIIALSSEGNFDTSKPIENTNLYPILENVRSMMYISEYCPYKHRIIKCTPTKLCYGGESVWCNYCNEFHSLKLTPEIIKIEYGDWEVYEEKKPVIPVTWGQGFPYNSKLDGIDRELPPAGCVATAVAQIMCYHRSPKVLARDNKIFYDWDLIINERYHPYAQSQIGELFRELGQKDNLNIHYTLNGSSSTIERAIHTFRKYGYSCSDKKDYSWDVVHTEFENNRPVYISAKYEKDKAGHAWVLDGFKILRRKIFIYYDNENMDIKEDYEYENMVYCNLGWAIDEYAHRNGYYYSGIFDFGSDNNYKYNQKILTHIYVKR